MKPAEREIMRMVREHGPWEEEWLLRRASPDREVNAAAIQTLVDRGELELIVGVRSGAKWYRKKISVDA